MYVNELLSNIEQWFVSVSIFYDPLTNLSKPPSPHPPHPHPLHT